MPEEPELPVENRFGTRRARGVGGHAICTRIGSAPCAWLGTLSIPALARESPPGAPTRTGGLTRLVQLRRSVQARTWSP